MSGLWTLFDLEKKSLKLGSTEEHSKLINQIILDVGSTKWARVWKNVTGTGRRSGNYISFGLVGSSDVLGILINGRFLAIEGKTGNAVLSKRQKAFKTMIEKFGGVYIVARPGDDILMKVIKEATL